MSRRPERSARMVSANDWVDRPMSAQSAGAIVVDFGDLTGFRRSIPPQHPTTGDHRRLAAEPIGLVLSSPPRQGNPTVAHWSPASDPGSQAPPSSMPSRADLGDAHLQTKPEPAK